MTKEEMLSAIYESMADKTLSDGCLCYLDDAVFYSVCKSDKVTTEQDSLILYRYSDDEYYSITSIIGNPVRIGDVIEYFTINFVEIIRSGIDRISFFTDIITLWEKPRLPIDEQSYECIEFVYNLIKK